MSDPAEWVHAFAPATVANVTCGFDIFGFALASPGDRVAARRSETSGVTLSDVVGDGGALPREAARNTAGVAAQCVLDEARLAGHALLGVELRLTKGLPLASGLGSSAASAAAAAVAVNSLLERSLEPEDLLRCVTEGERVASGFAHADNAAACLFGGFVLVRGVGANARVDSLPVAGDIACAMLHPELEIDTRSARAVIPRTIPLEDAVVQWGNTSALVAGLIQGDHSLLASAMNDVVAEPVRTPRVPGFARIRQAALEAGAIGCGLSGSGPSIFAFCPDRLQAGMVAEAMKAACVESGTNGQAWTSAVGAAGARIVANPGSASGAEA